jgi:hypothetical protein
MPLYRIVNSERLLEPFRATELGAKYRERDLEDWIEANPQVLVDDEPLLIIGRQVNTPVGIVDLLALDAEGTGLVIELKRAPDQRSAISQALEYTAWFAALSAEQVQAIAETYLRAHACGGTLAETWYDTFGETLSEADLNDRQRIFLVTEGNDQRITAVASYLRTSGLDINLLSYSYYRLESGEEILSLLSLVGDDQAPAGSRTRRLPTEQQIRELWSPEIRAAYDVFRGAMVAEGLSLQMKASGVSFYKQAREGSVFICFVNDSNGGFSMWLRADSMTARLDFDATAQEIRRAVPAGTQIKHTARWFILTMPPQATEADVRGVAEVILRKVADRID